MRNVTAWLFTLVLLLGAPTWVYAVDLSLAEVISTMAKYQLGRDIPEDDIRSIIRFLYTLPGEYKGKSLEPKSREHLEFSDQPTHGEQR